LHLKSDLKNTKTYDALAIAKGLQSGNIADLSKAITLVESINSEYRKYGEQILSICNQNPKSSERIGITGVPGVGKSTFIESFGLFLIHQGYKVAVLAIDPSSKKSGGSILGDKTRMSILSTESNAYIRPSASGETLGGVAARTKEIILLCESAGYDKVIIETVGVGQSETAVKDLCDFFILLMLSGAGDELQGIKRGIMEMSDLLLITKADGSNIEKSKLAAAQYKNALHLLPQNEMNWLVPVLITSAIENKGLSEVYEKMQSFFNQSKFTGWFHKNRGVQNHLSLEASILSHMHSKLKQNKQWAESVMQKIEQGQMLPHEFIAQFLV
jgi:LAO/AO transport system kinase